MISLMKTTPIIFLDKIGIFLGMEEADPDNVDMDIWAQEFPKEDIEMFKNMLNDGRLYIATFHNDNHGTLKIIICE